MALYFSKLVLPFKLLLKCELKIHFQVYERKLRKYTKQANLPQGQSQQYESSLSLMHLETQTWGNSSFQHQVS